MIRLVHFTPVLSISPHGQFSTGTLIGYLSAEGHCLVHHNALASIISCNLPFIPTTGTLYQSIHGLMLIDSQISHVISDGDSKSRPSKYLYYSVRDWSITTLLQGGGPTKCEKSLVQIFFYLPFSKGKMSLAHTPPPVSLPPPPSP